LDVIDEFYLYVERGEERPSRKKDTRVDEVQPRSFV